jgi:type IV secretion system protein TrbL
MGVAAASPLRRAAASIAGSHSAGMKTAFASTGGTTTQGTVTAAAPSSAPGGAPAWAQQLRRSRAMSHGVTAAAHAVRAGDSHGGGSSISLSESDRT